jgi:hypothetical protein
MGALTRTYAVGETVTIVNINSSLCVVISGLSPLCQYINHKISFRGSSIFSLFFALLIVILDIFLGIETNKIGGDYVDFCLVNRKRSCDHW